MPRGKKKTTTSTKAQAAPVEEEVVLEEEVQEQTTTTKRRTPTRDSVLAELDAVLESIDTEITSIREGNSKNKGIKVLRSIAKKIKVAKAHAARVMKQKKRTARKGNQNSGFLKPVKISKEMAKFTGWKSSDLKSRVQVTKYICDYIKKHDLQNPEDRREIVPDAKLRKLLDFDPKKSEQPLRYYSLQTYLKPHFN
jgi:chromatin remodeling complex protein RSC6